MKPLIYLFLITFSYQACGQDASVFDRLHGKHIHKCLKLVFISETFGRDPAGFHYLTDDEEDNPFPFENSQFTVSNGNSNAFRVYMAFYNPLRYKITSEMSQVDDPVNTAVSQFLSSQTGNSVAQSSAVSSLLFGAGDVQIPESILLNRWLYDLIMAKAPSIAIGDPRFTKFSDYIANSQIISLETYLYGQIPIVKNGLQVKHDVSSWITSQKTDLYKDETYESFKGTLNFSDATVYTKIAAYKTTSEQGLNDIRILLTDKFDDIVKPLLVDNISSITAAENIKIEAFRNYSKIEAAAILRDAAPLVEKTNTSVKVYKDFIGNLQKFLEKFKTGNEDINKHKFVYRTEDFNSFSWQSTKMSKYKYSCQKLKEDGSEDNSSSDDVKSKFITEFSIAKYQALVPFVSTGVLYTSLSYPSYGIENVNGVNKVIESGKEKVNLRPVLFLNLLARAPVDFAYPFIQIGVSTGINDAIFPFGIGILFRNTFSISGGKILGYRKGLNKLEIGGNVANYEALKSDLVDVPFSQAYYFSLNFKLSK
jgi:hypothetical protein